MCRASNGNLAASAQVFGLLFAAGTAAFGWSVWTQRANAHRVHHLMAVLGVFKALTLLALCGMYHYIRVTGAPDGWNDVYYVFTFFRALLLFTVIVLIGTGWSYMTPHLSTNEKRVLMIVIPLQVRARDALVVSAVQSDLPPPSSCDPIVPAAAGSSSHPRCLQSCCAGLL